MGKDGNRIETQEQSVAPMAAGASRLGREAKIGVTIIGLLVMTLGGVVAWRMMKPEAEEPVAAAPTPESSKENGKLPPAKSVDDMLKGSKPGPSSSNPMKMAASKPLSDPMKAGGEDKPWRLKGRSEEKGLASDMGKPTAPPPFSPEPSKQQAAGDRYAALAAPPIPDGEDGQPRPLRHHEEGRARHQMSADEPVNLEPPKPMHPDAVDGFASVESAPVPSADSSIPSYRKDRDEGRDSRFSRPGNDRPESGNTEQGGRRYGMSNTEPAREIPVSNRMPSQPRRSAPMARSPAPHREDGKYEVQPNDSYWTISERLYGSGNYFKALAEVNKGKAGEDRLQPGELISAPSIAELEKSYPDLCPKAGRREAIQTQTQNRISTAGTHGMHRGGRTYTVAEGDTLFNIARYELGKASRWVEIYELNRDVLGKDFNYLTPGTQLTMPSGADADVVAEKNGYPQR